MKFLWPVTYLICIHIYLDLIFLPLTYLNFIHLSFLMQVWAFIQQFRHMRSAVNFRTVRCLESIRFCMWSMILSDLIIQCKQDVFLGRVLLDRGKIAISYWERCKKANMKMKRCRVSMDIFHGTYH